VEGIHDILSTFLCPYNKDIENFLKARALDFSARGIAQTHLVIGDVNGEAALLGYFTLTNKILMLSSDDLSKSMLRKVQLFGVHDEETGIYSIPTPLIAQLGKNYAGNRNQFFNGSILLETACGKVASIQDELGGRLVYIECDNTPKLIDFYLENKFRRIDGGIPKHSDALIKMIRYL
jgi:hypothetical protein